MMDWITTKVNSIKNFIKRNSSILFFILLIIIVVSIIYNLNQKSRDNLEAVATILAIPSFLMSFFVLNTLDLKPDHLNKYYFKRRKKEKFDELSSQEVKDTIKNDLPPLLNSLEKYQNFVINVQIAVPNSK